MCCVCMCMVYSSGAQVQLGSSFGIHWFPDDKSSISKWNISIMFKLFLTFNTVAIDPKATQTAILKFPVKYLITGNHVN